MESQTISVSEFVALINQTMEYAYPVVRIEGEISELRISKGKWVYFNLVDDHSSIRVFGTVYHLRENFEDGMRVVVKGSPRLHNKYGFSLNMTSIQPSGEGSIKRAFELVKKKLTAEGLFDDDRKRPVPYAPTKIGLITSSQAAAYGDFMKILEERWAGVEVRLANVNVQGEAAPRQIVNAIQHFAAESTPVDVLVITRGGGGAEDLMAFSTEEVARAVAGSRIPTIVGVGHEVDVSLADMAADVRATTPTNAAQLVVPDKRVVVDSIDRGVDDMQARVMSQIDSGLQVADGLVLALKRSIDSSIEAVDRFRDVVFSGIGRLIENGERDIASIDKQLKLVNPLAVLSRGYSLVTDATGKAVTDAKQLKKGQKIKVRLNKGYATTEVIDAK